MKAILFVLLTFSLPALGWRCNVPAATVTHDNSRDGACVQGLLQRLIANARFEIAKDYTTYLAHPQSGSGTYNLGVYANRRLFDQRLQELRDYLEIQKLNNDQPPTLVQCVAPDSD